MSSAGKKWKTAHLKHDQVGVDVAGRLGADEETRDLEEVVQVAVERFRRSVPACLGAVLVAKPQQGTQADGSEERTSMTSSAMGLVTSL